jgi:hypothetical protein
MAVASKDNYLCKKCKHLKYCWKVNYEYNLNGQTCIYYERKNLLSQILQKFNRITAFTQPI